MNPHAALVIRDGKRMRTTLAAVAFYVLGVLNIPGLASASDVTIYDPNPEHLWNRLHCALWVRTGPDGKEYGGDRLDPLLWLETKHLLEGTSHDVAIALLDE